MTDEEKILRAKRLGYQVHSDAWGEFFHYVRPDGAIDSEAWETEEEAWEAAGRDSGLWAADHGYNPDHYEPLSPWQWKVADTYGIGDFAHVQTIQESLEVGDALFAFLMIELSPGEDCDSWEEARRRVEVAIRDLEQVREALT